MAAKRSLSLRQLRLILWALVVIVGVGATVLYFVRPPQRPIGLFGAKFSLTSTKGGTFTQNDLKGEASLMYFGYTYCPDICPTTLYDTTTWRKQLGISPDQLRIIFVTVDPERDTIDLLKKYLGSFAPDIIGLRGTAAETEAAKKAFGVYSKKVVDASSTDYLVDHTANVFLLDKNGVFQGTLDYGEDPDVAKAKIKKLVGI